MPGYSIRASKWVSRQSSRYALSGLSANIEEFVVVCICNQAQARQFEQDGFLLIPRQSLIRHEARLVPRQLNRAAAVLTVDFDEVAIVASGMKNAACFCRWRKEILPARIATR